MSVVKITVMQTQVVGVSTIKFGVLFQDEYDTEFEQFDSLEELTEQYPSPQSLIDALQNFNGFAGSEYVDIDATELEIGQHRVIVIGYPN